MGKPASDLRCVSMIKTDSLKVSNLPLKQLLRYAVVGVVSNLSGYCAYLLITFFGVDPKLAMTFLYAIGAAVGFFGNRTWAFSHRGEWWRAAAGYAVAHVFGYLLNLTILYVFVDKLGYRHQIVQGIAIFVVAGYLFLAFKLVVFRATENKQELS